MRVKQLSAVAVERSDSACKRLCKGMHRHVGSQLGRGLDNYATMLINITHRVEVATLTSSLPDPDRIDRFLGIRSQVLPCRHLAQKQSISG